MKKISKVTSFLLALVVVLSMFAVSSFAVATPLSAGNSKESATEIPSFGTEYVSELSVGTENDWFKFTTLPDDAYYNISFKVYSLPSTTSIFGERYSGNCNLYDEYLQQLSTGYTNCTFNLKLEPNSTYYIKVFNGKDNLDATGTYAVKIEYAYDEDENNYVDATKINLNQSYYKSLDGYGDVDWFMFTAPKDDVCKIKFTLGSLPALSTAFATNDATNCTVYDANLKELATGYDNQTYTISVEEGVTYYIKVYNGKYSLGVTGTYEIEVECNSVKSLSGIAISSMPNKTTYIVGESFDATGLVVKANYSDGTSAVVNSYDISGFDSSTSGTKTIIVSYTENGITQNTTFNIIVTETDDTISDDCSCNCHKTGISKVIFKIVLFFQKIFGLNKTCVCGIAHY